MDTGHSRYTTGIGLIFTFFFTLSLLPTTTTSLASATDIFYVDASANGENDCSSWVDACTDLQIALSSADLGDQIWVSAGTYRPGNNRVATFQLKTGVTMLGGFPAGGGNLDSRDWEANLSILSGDIGTPHNIADNTYHVVTGSGVDQTTVLDGFTIKDGNANLPAVPNYMGGGLYIDSGSPIIKNVKINNNKGQYGAGVYNTNNSNSVYINVKFIDNETIPVINGHVYGGGFYNENSSPVIRDSTFIGNKSIGEYGKGGGLHNHFGTTYIIKTTFENNIAQATECSSSCGGGGIFEYYGGLIVINSNFFNNTSIIDFATGPDIYYGGGGAIRIIGTISQITNSLFVGNAATGSNGVRTVGGAVFSSSDNVGIFNSTFAKNTGQYCCNSIFNGGLMKVVNSIIGTNSDSISQVGPLPYSGTTVNYSLIRGGFSGIGNLSSDPQFVDPENSNYRLTPSSPSIDAGNNNELPSDTIDLDSDGNTTEKIPLDLDENIRIFEMPVQPNTGSGDFPLVDMGAYELINSAPVLDNSGNPTLNTIACDETGNSGTLIAELIATGAGGDPITDADPNAQEGLAVIGVDSTNGTWQYSTNGGNSWQDFGAISAEAAVLIGDGPEDRIRFVPQISFSGTVVEGITFRAWDRSDGFSSGHRDTNIFITGGSGPYSVEVESASIHVGDLPVYIFLYLPLVVSSYVPSP